jgi:hypothetical protein
MSLNYNFTKIVNADTLCWETYTGTTEELEALVRRVTFMGPDWSWASVTRMSVTTHCMIWASIHVGLSGITEKNWQEFYTRLSTVERTLGAFRSDEARTPVFFTPEDVRAHIGLSMNVGDESKAKFNAKIARWHRENARKALRDAAQEAK